MPAPASRLAQRLLYNRPAWIHSPWAACGLPIPSNLQYQSTQMLQQQGSTSSSTRSGSGSGGGGGRGQGLVYQGLENAIKEAYHQRNIPSKKHTIKSRGTRAAAAVEAAAGAARLLGHGGIGDDNEGLGTEAEAEDLAVGQEQLVQWHEHRLPHDLPDVPRRLRHAPAGGTRPRARLPRHLQRRQPPCRSQGRAQDDALRQEGRGTTTTSRTQIA